MFNPTKVDSILKGWGGGIPNLDKVQCGLFFLSEMSHKLENDVIVQPEVVVSRRLGLSSGIAFVVGTIIGTAIL